MKKWMSENFKIILIIVFCVIEMNVEEIRKNYVFNMISSRMIGWINTNLTGLKRIMYRIMIVWCYNVNNDQNECEWFILL